MSELLSPAGNLEKLKTAYSYGADACYMGLEHFSLRANADNFSEKDITEVKQIKSKNNKRLYLALNILFAQFFQVIFKRSMAIYRRLTLSQQI